VLAQRGCGVFEDNDRIWTTGRPKHSATFPILQRDLNDDVACRSRDISVLPLLIHHQPIDPTANGQPSDFRSVGERHKREVINMNLCAQQLASPRNHGQAPMSTVLPARFKAVIVSYQKRSVAGVQRGITDSGKTMTRAGDDSACDWTSSAI
jgi:hypothetical protein